MSGLTRACFSQRPQMYLGTIFMVELDSFRIMNEIKNKQLNMLEIRSENLLSVITNTISSIFLYFFLSLFIVHES